MFIPNSIPFMLGERCREWAVDKQITELTR